MGLNGDMYDDWGPDGYTPNKDRRMKEWLDKKKADADESKKRYIDRYYDKVHGRESNNEYGTGRHIDFYKGLNIKNSLKNRPSRDEEPPQQPGLFD